MSVILKGGISNILADVDSSNNLKVNLPTVLSEAGTYLHIILKTPISVTTSSLVYRGNVIINGYWE